MQEYTSQEKRRAIALAGKLGPMEAGRRQGVCVDLQRDADHCGDCTTACAGANHADPVCTTGNCALVCHSGWEDEYSDPTDGCEAPVLETEEQPDDLLSSGCSCRDRPIGGAWLAMVAVCLARRRRPTGVVRELGRGVNAVRGLPMTVGLLEVSRQTPSHAPRRGAQNP